VKETRPRRPQTGGKVGRFHRILLEEWAYHPPLGHRSATPPRLHRVHPLVQSPPTPWITRLGDTLQHPQGQAPREHS
jgi:hypothetical protein